MTIEELLKELPSELLIIPMRITEKGIASKTIFYNKISLPKEILTQEIFSIEPVLVQENSNFRPCIAIRYLIDYNKNEVKLYSKNIVSLKDSENVILNIVKDNRERDEEEDDDLYGLNGGERFLEALYNDTEE